MWVSRAGTGNRPNSVIEMTPGEGAGLLGDVFTDIGAGGGGGGGFGGGGGGGGGPMLPTYRGPDKRVVTDYVKGVLTSFLGFVPEHLLGPGVEAFMADHRRNFDEQLAADLAGADSAEVDPQQSVIEYIRGTEEYQTIHKLRPDGVDERDWVAQQRQLGERGGLETDLDQFAINQATVAGSAEDVERAGAVQQFQKSGQMPTLLSNQFSQIAQAMMSRVAR
jgi:hypothetical protein